MDAARRRLRLACLGASALAAACATTSTPDPNAPRAPPKVEHAGAMQELFDAGAAPGTIAVEPLLAKPHVYALGPLADLRGELLVWDGTPFTSRVRDGRVVVATEHDLSVPLIVLVHATQWRQVAVPEEARALADFEAWLPGAAHDAGLDETQPFAFEIVGSVERATLHVVDLPPGTPLTHESHDATMKVVELANAPIQALGFHATDAKGIWTHHDRNVHVHLRSLFGATMGHVDDFTLAPGSLVRLAWR